MEPASTIERRKCASDEQVLRGILGGDPDGELLDFAAGAGGNQRLLVEFALGLVEEELSIKNDGVVRLAERRIPRRVPAFVQRRLGDLSTSCQHFLKVAAALGTSFMLEDVSTMLDRSSASLLSSLDEAIASNFVVADDLQLVFQSDFLWRGILESIPAPARGALQREALVHCQLLDLVNHASDAEDIDSALRVNRYKTASYTVERPLHFGAAIVGAEADLVAAYQAFGADIGIAFQLRDDLLGVFGDPAVTGKPSGDDLREGKRTVLLATALKRVDERDPEAAEFLRATIGTDLSDGELATVRRVLVDIGAVAHIERQIAVRTDRALTVLEASSATAPARDQLAAMAIDATQRAR
ncbi:polyprenyl synthetase family protein [Streptomyces griseus]|uniref:polyprenyl synthetase family protein n=1 Tax=Streptomyces griseus TaxID=1911 RepID=UPI00099BBCEB|nr:polyprenyl synthetase family protein [Streptomyces griseus]